MKRDAGYRADIEGLRAVAVLAVLVFHLGFEQVSGGLVGVDVFYVISGFLITGMVLGARDFSFADFYLRRISRLVPALAVTVAVTIIAGFLLTDAETYERLGETGLHSVLATSNILFWNTLGYFDEAALTEPLLHTWSLSVEWQFYLIWPGLIFAANRMGGLHAVMAVVGAVFSLSLLAEQYWTYRDPSAAFYLSPFRAFEFALGGAVYLTGPIGDRLPRWTREAVAICAIGLIGVAVLLKGPETPFPGTWVLLPVVGTGLLILSPGTSVARLLSTAPMTAIGRLSYSLYLVHWPIITLTRYVLYRPLTLTDQIILTAATFAAAFVLYRYVEHPLRARGKVAWKSPGYRFAATIGLIVVSAAAGWTVKAEAGFPDRVSSQYKASFFGHLPCGTEGDIPSLNMLRCTFGSNKRGKILLIGDSHSRHFAFGLSKSSLGESYEFVSISSGTCLPFTTRVRKPNGVLDPVCAEAKLMIHEELQQDYALVIFSARWIGYIAIKADELRELADAAKAPVVAIGPTPDPEWKRPCDRPTFVALGSCSTFRLASRDVIKEKQAAKASEEAGIAYVDLISRVCTGGLCPFYIDAKAVYADRNHLSKVGSVFYVATFVDDLTRLLQASATKVSVSRP